MTCAGDGGCYCVQIGSQSVYVTCKVCGEKLSAIVKGNEIQVSPCFTCARTVISLGERQNSLRKQTKTS